MVEVSDNPRMSYGSLYVKRHIHRHGKQVRGCHGLGERDGTANGDGLSLGGDGGILEPDGVGGCTALRIYEW